MCVCLYGVAPRVLHIELVRELLLGIDRYGRVASIDQQILVRPITIYRAVSKNETRTRGACDLVAESFRLAPIDKGIVSVAPAIRENTVHFDSVCWRAQLDSFHCTHTCVAIGDHVGSLALIGHDGNVIENVVALALVVEVAVFYDLRNEMVLDDVADRG